MEVLSSRLIVRCEDLDASVGFWRDTVGLRVYREYGTGGRRTGVVLFCGGGFLELTGGGPASGDGARPLLWLQVPEVDEEAARLRRAGVDVDEPATRPWGLREAPFRAPDGLDAVLVEAPDGHPIRTRLDG